MAEPAHEEKLSDKEYWDSVLADQKLPRVNTRDNYNYRITMHFIKDAISDKGFKTFFEVGCGSSGWLPYFAMQYGFLVSGIDYSEIGCKLAEENLRLLKIPFEPIICKDIFAPYCTNGKTYDVIFSYGVIEHFESPETLLRIFSNFTNPNGIIITLVPNLNGINGALTRYFLKDVYDMHKVITLEQLKYFHEVNGLTNIKTGYAGAFSLSVIPWIKCQKGLFKEGSVSRKITLKIIYGFNLVISSLFKILPFNLSSRYFSPYIISIAKK